LALKDRSLWRPGGHPGGALAKEIAEVVEEAVPEIAGAVSQPIQMRTNELVAGIRSDVAAIVYGPDLDELKELGDKLAAALRRVPGAVDVRAEQVAGLRYLRVIPDRARLARYGLTIEDVNQITETMAVGHQVGRARRRAPLRPDDQDQPWFLGRSRRAQARCRSSR
jgi:cobalt-zinc-cadmium resistance protein CzcA